jgi:hypothetical protein
MFARTFSRKGLTDDNPSPPVRRGSSSPALAHRKSVVSQDSSSSSGGGGGLGGVTAPAPALASPPSAVIGSPVGSDSAKGNAAAQSLLNRRKTIKAKQAAEAASQVAVAASAIAPPVFAASASPQGVREENHEKPPNEAPKRDPPIMQKSSNDFDRREVNDLVSAVSPRIVEDGPIKSHSRDAPEGQTGPDLPSCGVSPLPTPDLSAHMRVIHAESSSRTSHAKGDPALQRELFDTDLELVSAKNPSDRIDDLSPKPQSLDVSSDVPNNVSKKRPASGGASRSPYQGSGQRPAPSQRPKTAIPGQGGYGASSRVVPTQLNFDYDQDLLESPVIWQRQLIKSTPQGVASSFSYDIGSKRSRRSNRYRQETQNHSPGGM